MAASLCPSLDLLGRRPPADLPNTAQAGRGLLLAGVVIGKVAPLHPMCLVSSRLAGTKFLSPEPSPPNLLSASRLEGTSFLAQNAPASREGSSRRPFGLPNTNVNGSDLELHT